MGSRKHPQNKAAKSEKAKGKSAAAKSTKEKGAKSPVSKLSSIKQAIFGSQSGQAGKKGSTISAKAPVTHKKSAGHGTAATPSTNKKGAHHHHKEKEAPVAKATKGHEHVAHKDAHLSAKAKGKTHQSAPHSAHSAQVAPAVTSTKKHVSGSSAKGAKGSVVPVRSALVETGETVCREVACEGLATSAGYCRLHYIKNWKKIKRKEVILKEGKLNQYIEELVAKYPDKYIEAIRQDLASDKDFAKVIYDLDLDETMDDFDVEGENSDNIIDSIKRDFDDEGDTGF
jgi:hypothetical protein